MRRFWRKNILGRVNSECKGFNSNEFGILKIRKKVIVEIVVSK